MFNKKIMFIVLLSSLSINIAYGETAVLNEQEQLFHQSLKEMYPLAPEEVNKVIETGRDIERVIEKTPVAKIRTGSKSIDLELGKPIDPVVLTPYYVGSIGFFDITGQAWRISRAVLGNTNLFNLVSSSMALTDESVGDEHILYITPNTEYANSNILVFLEGSPTPINIPLISSESSSNSRTHDGITNFTVNARGPLASQPVYVTSNPTISNDMMTVLDGVMPSGSKKLKLSQEVSDLDVYALDKLLLVRTKHQLILPAYRAMAKNGDVTVYEIAFVGSIILSINGKSTSISLE